MSGPRRRMRMHLMLCMKETHKMTEPDDPTSATLLDEAAQLATAANAKLSEALAIAGQTRRDEALMPTGVLPRQPGSQLSRPARYGAGDR
jgi:hypothetical protein